ncbi:hypothetical protein BOTBODRAFT_459203 [Botryobasidium botryosum FD-172 SS1]|uniref:RlpA-like protein double-psi beta-barrel domain-containing protein n=1 Tax=Botryobasidium botryosum (strain FD-172 SS1) TaxID=930990 RepID=A0A067M755_BOTB1|nr:hypothetical protein BOTBODRAFT_459203 [Botryobasidium botryosum FD-172 SS1]
MLTFQKITVASLLFASSLFAFAAAAPAERSLKTGDATYYNPGLGACGKSNTGADQVVAVSQQLFDTYPGHTSNPNANPICGRRVKVNYGGKSVVVTVEDRCPACAFNDLDLSPSAFQALAPLAAGRLRGMTWDFV